MAALTRWTAPGRLFVAPDRGPFSPLRFHRQREPLQAMAFWRKQRERICVQCSANGKPAGISRQVCTDKIGEKGWAAKEIARRLTRVCTKDIVKGKTGIRFYTSLPLHPVRGRGLKCLHEGLDPSVWSSHPVRGRGLKSWRWRDFLS